MNKPNQPAAGKIIHKDGTYHKRPTNRRNITMLTDGVLMRSSGKMKPPH